MEILSKHDYLHGPCERGDLIRTVQVLAEALINQRTIERLDEPFHTEDERILSARSLIEELREKGWITS